MKKKNNEEVGKVVVEIEAAALLRLADNLPTDFSPTIEAVLKTRGRVIVSGIGKSGHVGRKIDFWRSWMAFKNEHDAGYLSESIFGRFGGDLGVQNRPKIGPESVSRAIMT